MRLLLRLLTAAGLAVDAWVHFDLAGNYDPVKATVSQGALFRVEAAAALLAAVLVLFLANRASWGFALLVAAAGVAAVLVYRYVDVGKIGPLPNMYEPGWYAEKTLSALAEGVATVTAALGLRLSAARTRARVAVHR